MQTQENPMDNRLTIILERIRLVQACLMIPFVWTVFTLARIGIVSNANMRKVFLCAALALSLLVLDALWDGLVAVAQGMRHPLSSLRNWGMRQWAYATIVLVILLVSWQAPRMLVNHRNPLGALYRGHCRYYEGRWIEALAIYHLVDFQDEDEVSNLREMKALLSQAGYYKHPIDDTLDRNILASFRQLQRDYGFEPDGIVDFKTSTVLYGLVHRKLLNLTGSDAPTYSAISDAVMEFQRQHGLYADGAIDTDTLRAIKKAERGPLNQETDSQSFKFSFQDLGSLASTTAGLMINHRILCYSHSTFSQRLL